MSSYLRATHLIDLCTPSISYDRQVQSACKAFDEQMFEIIDDTGQVIMIPNIMNIDDENLINILAWQFHVDFYDTSRDLEFRKRLVQMSIIWHRTKGTVSLVQDVLDTYWEHGAYIEEWFQYYDPLPPNYPTSPPDTLVGMITPAHINIAENRIDLAAHGLTTNQVIRFSCDAGARLPTALVEGVWYRVRNALTNSFQVAVMVTGPLCVFTDTGLGVNRVWLRATGLSWHDRYKFRIMLNQSVITQEDLEAVLTLIDRYKPVSRWCEGIYRAYPSECDIGTTGMVLRFIYRSSECPDDWSPGPEPPPEPPGTIKARLNKLLDPVTFIGQANDPIATQLIKTFTPSVRDITGAVRVVSNLSKQLNPVTLISQVGASNPFKVHFVYFIPSDKTDRASAQIQQMGYELQRWMRWRMGNGKTFTPVFHVYHTSHTTAWYRENYIGGGATSGNLTVNSWYHIVTYQPGDDFTNVGGQNASNTFFKATGTTPANWTHGSLVSPTSGYFWINSLNELAAYAGGGFYQYHDDWFMYVDCEPSEGQYAGGTGGGYTSGVCLLGERDLNALLGEDELWTKCREVGGAGHEYLHTHSAPHAEQEYWVQSIMGVGYGSYPDCILQPSLQALLNANPFFAFVPESELHEPTICVFDDGL